MNAVFATEAALRDLALPRKVNLASLGNAVPHLHWHVVPRHGDDRHFPKPIWAEPSRAHAPRRIRARPRRAGRGAARPARLAMAELDLPTISRTPSPSSRDASGCAKWLQTVPLINVGPAHVRLLDAARGAERLQGRAGRAPQDPGAAARAGDASCRRSSRRSSPAAPRRSPRPSARS